MSLVFRLATLSDLESICTLFTQVITHMDANGIPQWDEVYPNREDFSEDIARKELYIAEKDGMVAAAYVLNTDCDPQYAKAAWRYPAATYQVIHRLCISPNFQKQGLGKATVEDILERTKAWGIESIRLDAFKANPSAVRLYQHFGFEIVGNAVFRKGAFYLMEKRL